MSEDTIRTQHILESLQDTVQKQLQEINRWSKLAEIAPPEEWLHYKDILDRTMNKIQDLSLHWRFQLLLDEYYKVKTKEDK